MNHFGYRAAVLATCLAGALGCASSRGPDLKTPVPEQYVLPPESDSRFSQPPEYPREVLNKEPIKAPPPGKLPSQQPGMSNPGGGLGRGMTPGGF